MPPYELTYGQAVIDLALLGGLRLDPWQADALCDCTAIRADKKWSCYEYAEIVPRQNGKGSIAEARVLAGLFLFEEELIMWSAHEHKTASEAFLRVRDLILVMERDGFLEHNRMRFTSGYGQETIVDSKTKQRVKFIARSKSSGRGFSGDLNIIDETFAFTRMQQDALMPTLSARKNAQILYTSTPPLDGISGEVLFDLRKRAMLGDESLGYRDWGMAGTLEDVLRSKVRLDDPAKWMSANPAIPSRITEETVAREFRSMDRLGFARERLGIWPKQMIGGGAIDMDKWQTLLNSSSTRTGKCALGVDIAPDRSCAAIALYGYGLTDDDGEILGHTQIANFDYGTQWIVPRLIELRDTLNPVAIGMGKGTFASLESLLDDAKITIPEDEPRYGDLLVLAGSEMAAACGHIIDAVRDRTMRVKPDPRQPEVLNAAVAGAQLRQTTDAITWSRRDEKTDITPVQAITNARYTFITRVNVIDQPSVFFGAWR